jgi:hypothetical protein
VTAIEWKDPVQVCSQGLMCIRMGRDILRLLLRPEGEKARHLQAHAAAERFNGPTIFNGDSTITSAVLGRILHHAETIIIEGSSYRMKRPHRNIISKNLCVSAAQRATSPIVHAAIYDATNAIYTAHFSLPLKMRGPTITWLPRFRSDSGAATASLQPCAG